ncbi:MAG: zinc ABC transporter substrate-binding protein [Nitrospirae bacterium]|nr:zinc ABC transporter substrate-binding protein [Nitrospirota bacterium]
MSYMARMKRFALISACILLLSCAQSAYAEKIKAVASIFPLGDVTRQIGGERVDVKIMLPAGASPHTFEPTPLEMMGLHDARVFVKAGAGLEFWAEKMLKASGSKNLIIMDSSSDMPLIRQVHSHAASASKKTAKMEHADPHVWLDPLLMKKIVDKIAEALSKADPPGNAYYTEKAERYKKELDALHSEIMNKVEKFRIKEYVTFHSAWNYFSRRYGLRVAGIIEESPGREPSPKHIAKIVKVLRDTNSRVVFAEPQFNPKIAEVVAKEADAKIAFLDPIGGEDIKGRDTYLRLMRYNLSVMEEAMR